MQILVNCDLQIHGGGDLTTRIERVVASTLDRFGSRITRVEVHVSDLNGQKLGERDKRCVMEARVAGLRPIAARHDAPTLTEAIHGAADKLERALEHVLGRIKDSPFLKVTRGYGGATGPAPMYHGHGSRRDERELDRDRFFRPG